MRKGLAVLLVLVVMLPCIISSANAWGFTLISTDINGDTSDTFHGGDTVYAHAKTVKNSEVCLYVVADKNEWAGGETLTDVSGGYETVTSDATTGYIPITAIWATTSGDAGNYDIVLDQNHNGILDDVDLVDCDIAVGFSVTVPEFATIAIPVAAILGLVLFFNHRKHKKE